MISISGSYLFFFLLHKKTTFANELLFEGKVVPLLGNFFLSYLHPLSLWYGVTHKNTSVRSTFDVVYDKRYHTAISMSTLLKTLAIVATLLVARSATGKFWHAK